MNRKGLRVMIQHSRITQTDEPKYEAADGCTGPASGPVHAALQRSKTFLIILLFEQLNDPVSSVCGCKPYHMYPLLNSNRT